MFESVNLKTIVRKLAEFKIRETDEATGKIKESNLSGMQSKMLLTILVKIMDNNAEEATFTKKKLANELNIREQHVNKDMQVLIKQGLIICDDTSIYNRTYKLGPYWSDKKQSKKGETNADETETRNNEN